MATNLLVDTTTSETSPNIQLHPIALLAIDDHATRSGIRKSGPILGALLGKYNGRSISVDQSFECGSKKLETHHQQLLLNEEWFTHMMVRQKEIFPELHLVGWYTFGVEPQPWHVQLSTQLKDKFDCDSPIFFLYQPSQLQGSTDGKLPFTIFEPVPVQDSGAMELDDSLTSAIKFRPIQYALETAPDEAIALADIMQGATPAVALTSNSQTQKSGESSGGRQTTTSENILPSGTKEEDYLRPEDAQLLSSIETKYNAVKMLQSRLEYISSYIKSLPPSYLTDASLAPKPDASIDHEVLRAISALAAQLNLTSPTDVLALETEQEHANTDEKLLELLAGLTRGAGDLKVLGRRVHTVDVRRKNPPPSAMAEPQPSFEV